MQQINIQGNFFQQLRSQIPRHMSLVDEVADLLEISNDSAYRRIRGETALTFEEIGLLSTKYGISVDGLTNTAANEVVFRYQPLDENSFTFEHYLKHIFSDLNKIDTLRSKQLYYLANELPFFQLLAVPELASFKLFLWSKTIFNFSRYKNEKFALSQILDQELIDIGREISRLYAKQPSIEVFHAGTIDATLNQIEYYWVSGLFYNKSDALALCDSLASFLNHLCFQAEIGVKYAYGSDIPVGVMQIRKDTYKLYYNEILNTDNTILVKAENKKLSYLTNSGHNGLFTNNEYFFDSTYGLVQQLLQKSTLISGTSEKERNKVFLRYHNKIDLLRQTIERSF